MRNQAGRRLTGIGTGFSPPSSPNSLTPAVRPIFGKPAVFSNNVAPIVGPVTRGITIPHPIKKGHKSGGPENGAAPWTSLQPGAKVGGSGGIGPGTTITSTTGAAPSGSGGTGTGGVNHGGGLTG